MSVGFEDGRQPVRAEIVSKRLVDDPIEQKRGRYAYDVAIVFEGDETMLHSQALCRFSRPVATPTAAIPASALRFQSGRVEGEGRLGPRSIWPPGQLPVGHTATSPKVLCA